MTQEDIVGAAFRVWGEALFQKMSLSDLAAELGCTKPALYRHFRSKDALLDAMYTSFFDRFAGFLSDCFDAPIANGKDGKDNEDALLLRFAVSLGEFFVRNKGEFLFLLSKVYGAEESERRLSLQLAERGVDLRHFLAAEKEAGGGGKKIQPTQPMHPSRVQLVIGAVLFFASRELFGAEPWHECGGPKEGGIDLPVFLRGLKEKIAHGLGFIEERVEKIDFETLEGAVSFDVAFDSGIDEIHLKLLKAVGEVLAETGPFEASMEMFARKSGLSKSSLYSHFENREEMIVSLFTNEFDRIAKIAAHNKAKSEVPEERLYLTLSTIADYLRRHTMILRAIDKARTRHKDPARDASTGHYARKKSLFQVTGEIFAGIHAPSIYGELDITKEDAEYILFMLVNALMFRPDGMDYGDVGNESMRVLFRFLTLGLAPQGLFLGAA
ncbi:MAG: TetR/AcrR family transcriptional regulator [Spirochaetaceae bacterium]|jgi:AcrR family transcriptional regulator|nr:TetR/AcrR family transcriptional regulator [Spirochaetaceae bacterium]